MCCWFVPGAGLVAHGAICDLPGADFERVFGPVWAPVGPGTRCDVLGGSCGVLISLAREFVALGSRPSLSSECPGSHAAPLWVKNNCPTHVNILFKCIQEYTYC
jgi:hypothetical protein